MFSGRMTVSASNGGNMKIKKLPVILFPALILACLAASCPSENSDEKLYSINITSMSGGSVTSNYECAKKNTKVRLTVRPDAGYKYSEGTLKVNNSADALTDIGTTVSGDSRYTFAMPGRNVSVHCNFLPIAAPSGNFAIFSGSMEGGVVEMSHSYAAYNTLITLTVKPEPGFIWTKNALKVNSPAGGGEVELTANGYDSQGYAKWTFRMPGADAAVTCNFEPMDVYSSKNFDASLCTFYDKFEGTSLDLTKWGYQNGSGAEYGVSGWGNDEAQYYFTGNVVVADGKLQIIAKKETRGGRQYTSGKIVTANSRGQPSLGEPSAGAGKKFSQAFGRFEAKIRLTKAEPGMWPAFWMMPVSNTYGGWPRSGEIDIMEMKGRLPTKASSTVHFRARYGEWEGNQYRGAEHTFLNGRDLTDWHIYGVHWTQDEIIFLIDGLQHRRIARSDWNTAFYSFASAPFDRDFHLILNLAVGGQFDGGRLPEDDELPIAMEVEWVRAYTPENNPWGILGAVPGTHVRNY